MKARTKSALLILITLIVGTLIGAFGQSALHQWRRSDLRDTSFSEMVERTIQPADEAQRAQIRPVLEHSEARFSRARRECRSHFSAARDSMQASLNPLLTPGQRDRLDTWLNRDRRQRDGQQNRDARRNHQRRDTTSARQAAPSSQ